MSEISTLIRNRAFTVQPRRAGLRASLAVAAACACPVAFAQVPQYDHVVVVVMENHSFNEIIGNTANAPYINSLAASAATFTQSFGIEHPSQPNYLDLFSGSNQGVTTDACVSPLLTADNLGNQLRTAGFTFVGYSEDLPSPGSTVCTAVLYAQKHSPWAVFADLSGVVAAVTSQPFSSFPSDFSTLPTLSFVIPNLCNDMHGASPTCAASISLGDTWLQANLAAYATWASTHNSLLVLTWDEDDSSQSNQVATIFSGALVIPGNYSETINHYSVLATLETMYGLTPLAGAASATVITDVWDHRIFADGFE